MKIPAVALVVMLVAGILSAQTTEFTYQGQLKDNNLPPTANYDFEFRLFGVENGGSAIATASRPNVALTSGVFSVKIDFGLNFTSAVRWLEIAVKPAGSPNPYTTLGPRQIFNSAPYAIRSRDSTSADTATNALQLGGVIAASFVQTTDPRLADARNPTAGSLSYVQNTTVQQPSTSFNISGNGTLGGSLSAGSANISNAFSAGSATITNNLSAASANVTNALTAGSISTASSSVTGVSSATIFDAASQFNIGGQRILKLSPASIHLGQLAGESWISGTGNSYFGDRAGRFATNAGNNSFFGRSAGELNTASDNSFFGAFAGDSNTTGTRNSFFGRTAGDTNVSANDNSFFGFSAGRTTTAGENSFFGSQTGDSNTAGTRNSFFGFKAGSTNTTGNDNSFFGWEAGAVNTANDNAFFGTGAGNANTTGAGNAYFGSGAGGATTISNNNSYFGYDAGGFVNTGSNNSFFGYRAGASNEALSGNSFFGAGAGQLGAGDEDSFFGYQAGLYSRHGNNTFFGWRAGANTGNFLGTIEADDNAFFGHNAGSLNTTGFHNSYFGSGAGGRDTGGNFNVYVGSGTGYTGASETTASWNTLVGYSANYGQTDNVFATALGANSFVNTDDTIVLGKTGGLHGGVNRPADRVLIHGFLVLESLAPGGSADVCRNVLEQLSTCSSSLRYKTNVESFSSGLNIVRRLRPITFNWKDGGMEDVGFGAEEVDKIEPLLTTRNDKGEIEGVKYGQITTVLVNAVNEQQGIIERQQKEIKDLKAIVCEIKPEAGICRKD